jgi:ABC-2 type transport system ATP-binding protein
MVSPEEAIVVNKLSRSFGAVRALDALSFTARYGELIGLIGPNGAGKTTAMRLLSTYLEPNSGSAIVGGFNTQTEPERVREVIGYIPENSPLYGEMTVTEFLKFIVEARSIPVCDRKPALERVISLLNLQPVVNRRIEVLSKGFRRRVGLAQALIHNPKILILDEPTDGLDPNQKFDLREILREIAANSCVIVSTHDLDEVKRTCSRIVMLRSGCLVADQPVGSEDLDELFRGLTR